MHGKRQTMFRNMEGYINCAVCGMAFDHPRFQKLDFVTSLYHGHGKIFCGAQCSTTYHGLVKDGRI